MPQEGRLLSSHFPFLVPEALQKLLLCLELRVPDKKGPVDSSRSRWHCPGALWSWQLQEAQEQRKLPHGPLPPPAQLYCPPGPGSRSLRSPWAKQLGRWLGGGREAAVAGLRGLGSPTRERERPRRLQPLPWVSPGCWSTWRGCQPGREWAAAGREGWMAAGPEGLMPKPEFAAHPPAVV